MINASGDKERHFGLTDAVADVYPASFVICYGKIRQAHRAGVSGRSLAHSLLA
jgi:hypothetical protein